MTESILADGVRCAGPPGSFRALRETLEEISPF
jgi:hypothetical protein